MKRVLFLLSLVLCFPLYSNAQSWSGIIAPSRATDWTQAGITGGIPNRTKICATLNPGVSASDINSALKACPPGEVVYLNAGTYNLGSGQISFAGVHTVTLRGAGANKTFLNFSGASGYGCGGWGDPAVCLGGSTGHNRNSPQNVHNWTGNYSRGTTTLQFDSVSGYQVGTLLVLDQEEDTSDTGNVFVTELTPYSNEAYSPGRSCGNDTPGCRAQEEFVRVTAVNTSANTVTVDPPITMPNWRSSQAPQGWTMGVIGSTVGELDGVEDMSLDPDAAGSAIYDTVAVSSCYECWVKGVRAVHHYGRDTIAFFQTLKSEAVNNYIEGGTGATSNYGIDIEFTPGSYGLVMNNITQHDSPGIVFGDAIGWVVAYNYGVDDYFPSAPGWFDGNIRGHDAGDAMNLIEGNITPGMFFDSIHGTQNLLTFFRNRSFGHEADDTISIFALRLDPYVRYVNIIGNVFGTSGYSTFYQNTPSEYHNNSTTEYSFGLSYASVADDALTYKSSFRWGNYDTVNAAVRWDSSEVPSSLSPYGNAVPSSHTLPASFFLSAKPSWWSSGIPWPAIGPDVTGGNLPNVAGHAYENPAMACYVNVMGGSTAPNNDTLYSFNEDSCYSQGSDPPAPPTNLSAVSQ